MLRVRDINWFHSKYIRAGFIPIVEQGGQKFYGFGIGTLSDIGDLGGHRERKDIDALDAAIREYQEEGLGIFGNITRDAIQDYYVLDGPDTAEILLPVPGPFFQYTHRFAQVLGTNRVHEVTNIIWLNTSQLRTVVHSQNVMVMGTYLYVMYYRIHAAVLANLIELINRA